MRKWRIFRLKGVLKQVQDDIGFTLVELLVTISILATLIAVLLPNLMGTRQKARDSKKIQELGAVKNALRLYYNDYQIYPEGDGIDDLSTELGAYLPAISEIGYTYDQTAGGEGFNLRVGLESAAGDADNKSQTRCGVAEEAIVEGVYMVCTN